MAWGSISLFGGFLENENSLETLIVIFENISPKGSYWLKMKYFEVSVLTAANNKIPEITVEKNGKLNLC